MASITWRQNPSVEQALFEQAYTFDFDQAIVVLERLKRMGGNHTSFTEGATLGNASHIDFEPVTLKSHVTLATLASPLQRLEKGATKPILWMNFISLAGAQGPLPMPYTEMVIDRQRVKDTSFPDLLDIFNHRIATHWHQFHKTIKPSVGLVSPEQSTIGGCLLRFAGAVTERHASAKMLLSYHHQFWKYDRTLSGLECLLGHHFKLPIQVIGFQGRYHTARPEDTTRIGIHKGQWNALGQTTILGNKTFDQSAGIKIDIGPLNQTQHAAFQAGGASHAALMDLCRLYVSPQVHINVQLKLAPGNAVATVLMEQGMRLGVNTWIKQG